MVRQATRKLHASRSPSWLSLACHNQTMGAATLETQQPKTDAAGRKPKQARASQGKPGQAKSAGAVGHAISHAKPCRRCAASNARSPPPC